MRVVDLNRRLLNAYAISLSRVFNAVLICGANTRPFPPSLRRSRGKHLQVAVLLSRRYYLDMVPGIQLGRCPMSTRARSSVSSKA